MNEIKIIYRIATWKTILLAVLCGMTIVLSPWINKVLYQEQIIYIATDDKEYESSREKYQSFKISWRFESETKWRRPRYIFGVASKYIGEERETLMYHQAPKNLPIKD